MKFYDEFSVVLLFGASVGLTIARVIVVAIPPFPVVVITSVTTGGMFVSNTPWLFVVVMNIVVLSNTVILLKVLSCARSQVSEANSYSGISVFPGEEF